VTDFVRHHGPERVTGRMNQVVADVGIDERDVFRAEAARTVFGRTEVLFPFLKGNGFQLFDVRQILCTRTGTLVGNQILE
jgi:hypothetical protein